MSFFDSEFLMKQKLAIFAIAILALGLLSVSILPHDVDAKKPQKPACKSNIKIQVKVGNVSENQTVIGVVNLNFKVLSKAAIVEENETQVTLPFNFKKDCSVKGDIFFGDVNGTQFEGQVNSVKKPNKINVTLP